MVPSTVLVRALVKSAGEAVMSRLPSRAAAGDRLVLAYHNVVEPGTPTQGDQSLHLDLGAFEAQLAIVRREADLVSLEELLRGGTSRERLVAITFDDAYRSAMALALPRCSHAGASATVFVAPGLLGEPTPWDMFAFLGEWGEAERNRYLAAGGGRTSFTSERGSPEHFWVSTADELRIALSGTNHMLGNHTFSHANLGALAEQTVVSEIRQAHEWLSLHFPDHYRPQLAFPYGIAPATHPSAVETFVTHAFLVDGGWIRRSDKLDTWAVPRWNVPAGISDSGFQMRIRGWLIS